MVQIPLLNSAAPGRIVYMDPVPTLALVQPVGIAEGGVELIETLVNVPVASTPASCALTVRPTLTAPKAVTSAKECELPICVQVTPLVEYQPWITPAVRV